MSAGTVRTGGILSFACLALVVLAFVIGGTGGGILNLIGAVVSFVALFFMKGYLNSQGYRRADMFVWSIPVLFILLIVAPIVGNLTVISSARSAQASGSAPELLTILTLLGLAALAFLICTLMLGLRLSDFGKTGGGIWKGAGIVLIVAAALMLVGVFLILLTAIAESGGLGFIAGALFLIGRLVYLAFFAFFVVLGLAMIDGAGKMTA